jgi:hypothetical protein
VGSQDIAALVGLLDPNATAIADSGGLVIAFLHPIEGAEQIARAWIEIANLATDGVSFLERTVNGQPGLVAQQEGVTVTVFAFEVADSRIKHIWGDAESGETAAVDGELSPIPLRTRGSAVAGQGPERAGTAAPAH